MAGRLGIRPDVMLDALSELEAVPRDPTSTDRQGVEQAAAEGSPAEAATPSEGSPSSPIPPQPVPPPRRVGTRAGSLKLLVAVNLGFAAWMLGTAVLPRAAPAAVDQGAPPPDLCADAVERVQTYQAPGQREPVLDAITASLAAEAGQRPVALVGWEPPYVRGGHCEVGLRLSLGNELAMLRWTVRTDTGRVEAMNDLTKQMSGW
jgi:hypothetical protein